MYALRGEGHKCDILLGGLGFVTNRDGGEVGSKSPTLSVGNLASWKAPVQTFTAIYVEKLRCSLPLDRDHFRDMICYS